MVETSNTKKLDDLLAAQGSAVNVLQEALKEVNEERAEKRKDSAKALIREALDLQEQMNAAERRFTSEKKKWDKKLGKLINRLNAMAKGQPLPQEGENDDEEEGEGEGEASEE